MSEEDTQVVESAETTTSEDNQESYEQDDSTGESESEASGESGEQRSTETPDARLARLKRQYEREAKKQGVESGTQSKESTDESQEGNQEKEVDDRYERLELKTEGIKNKKEQDVVIEYASWKGIEVADALKSPVVKAELAELKAKASVPAPSKRTSNGVNDSFEYAKKEALKGNFPSDPAMRKRLEKARIFTK